MVFHLIVAVKKGIVNGLAIPKEDNTKGPVFKVGNPRPATYASVRLNLLGFRMTDRLQNPLILDANAVWTNPGMLKILR